MRRPKISLCLIGLVLLVGGVGASYSSISAFIDHLTRHSLSNAITALRGYGRLVSLLLCAVLAIYVCARLWRSARASLFSVSDCRSERGTPSSMGRRE